MFLTSIFVVLQACGTASHEVQAPVGDTLVVARVKDAVTLDPAQAGDALSLNVTTEIMKGLVQFKPGGFTLEPAIARSWNVSANGLTWTFRLHNGLRFSDGSPIDAAAVKFNVDRWRLPASPYHGNALFPEYASLFGGFPGRIADVRTPNATTVVFTLTRPLSPFLRDLAMPSFAIASPKALAADAGGFAQHPVGYGPYTIVEWMKGDHITLRANPLYPSHPAYQNVVIRDIPDQAASVLEMQRGVVDILTDPRPTDAMHLANVQGLRVYYQPPNNTSYLAMNMDRRPFEKAEVREAIAAALDIPALVQSFYPRGAIAASNWTPSTMIGSNPTLKIAAHDPKRARALLARAGLPHGFAATLTYSMTPRPYMPEPRLVAVTIARELEDVGIRVTLRPLEWDAFLRAVHNGEHALCLIGVVGDNGDPDNFLYTRLDQDAAHPPNATNYSFWRNPRFHALMIEGQETSDPRKRAAIYSEANALISREVPAVAIVHVAVPIVMKADIDGYLPSPDTHVAFEFLKPKG